MVAGYIITTIIGALVGFFFARWMFKRELKKTHQFQKMIRAMFMEMGRKPSETQIKRIMKSVNDQYK